MIPRHSLPYDINKLFSVVVTSVPAADPADVEKAYADVLGVRAVVLLPSVRAGIHLAILAASGPVTSATGPAYTCGTVHEAIVRSGVRMRLVDSAPGSFLMSPEDISAAVEPGCALVLSEVYGIPYDREMLEIASGRGPAVRILDMAMGIPSPGRMQQLQRSDVALFSFGWGKPMYAGWGGIACLQDPELAGRIRETLARWTMPESVALRFQRACATSLQTIMNQRTLYGLSHEPHIYRMLRKASSSRGERVCRPDTSGGNLPPQWTLPMTALNRKLALHNLRYSVQNADLRRDQAGTYQMSLVETGIVPDPGGKALPQSHFPIRVPSAMRNKMCDYLRGYGIDTGKLFPFPAWLSRDDYPHAAETADEVITLPMGRELTTGEVKAVSKRVEEGLRRIS